MNYNILFQFSVITQPIFWWMLEGAAAYYVFIDIKDMKSDTKFIVAKEPVIFSTSINLTIGEEKLNTFEMTAKDFTNADIVTHQLFIFEDLERLLIQFSEMDPADKFRVSNSFFFIFDCIGL